MSKLSNDNAPYISEAAINDVRQKVEEYRGSSALREKLRAMKEVARRSRHRRTALP